MVATGSQNFLSLTFCLLAALGYAEADLSASVHHHHHHKKHHHHHHRADAESDGNETAADPQDVQTQAKNAREAAASAKQSAHVANQVAAHSIDITEHAQAALKHAKKAIHGARVDTSGLSADQKESLRKAEEKLKAATQSADYGTFKNAKYAAGLGLNGTTATDSQVTGDARMRSKLGKLQDKLDTSEGAAAEEDVDSMRAQLRSLREGLAAKRLEETQGKKDGTEVVYDMGTATTEDDVSAEQMEQQLRDLEELVERKDKEGWKAVAGEPTKDEVKAEMERLRIGIAKLKGQEPQAQEDQALQQKRYRLQRLEDLERIRKLEAQTKDPEQRKMLAAQRAALEKELGISSGTSDADLIIEINQLRKGFGMEPYGEEYGTLSKKLGKKKVAGSFARGDDEEKDYDLDDLKSGDGDSKGSKTLGGDGSVTMGKGAFDIDTEMPYGELEPFGREDTAQELTESSIHESDQMVDQLERAEVAEEKRAVFRALTRLRGAAITSYDGVARSQTGNIDEYNKTHKWRKTHPLHHLADEESDISKWAFPDNADF